MKFVEKLHYFGLETQLNKQQLTIAKDHCNKLLISYVHNVNYIDLQIHSFYSRRIAVL